jgi:hypothetical protein
VNVCGVADVGWIGRCQEAHFKELMKRPY